MPWNMIERPTTPATRIVANSDSPGRASAGADARADGGEDVEEDEAQEQRLDDRARDELAQALAQHHQVAQQQGGEGDAARAHASNGSRTGLSGVPWSLPSVA